MPTHPSPPGTTTSHERGGSPSGDAPPSPGGVGTTSAPRLLAWWSPTPAELVGLAVLLLGALIASVLWWYPAVTGPGGTRAEDPSSTAAMVGAAVDQDGQAAGPAPGVEHPGPTSHGGTGSTMPGSAPAADTGSDHPDTQLGAAPPTSDGPAGAPPITVHVTGGVVVPGVVVLAGEARVADAVSAAGGLGGDADLERINLARPLVDGEHVHVPRIGEEPLPTVEQAAPGTAGGSGAVGGSGAIGADGLLDLNRANATELETLPGIGPTRAAAIVEYRERNGPFAVPGDLRAVSGIGEATFQTLAPLVVVR